MKPSLLLKIAAFVLGTFAIGHSIGHFTRHEVEDVNAQTALKAMTENKFVMFGTERTYEQYYTGMSLNLIFTILTLIMILWEVSRFCESHPKMAINILIPIVVCIGAFSATGWLFFFMGPAIACFITLLLIAISISKLKKMI